MHWKVNFPSLLLLFKHLKSTLCKVLRSKRSPTFTLSQLLNQQRVLLSCYYTNFYHLLYFSKTKNWYEILQFSLISLFHHCFYRINTLPKLYIICFNNWFIYFKNYRNTFFKKNFISIIFNFALGTRVRRIVLTIIYVSYCQKIWC